MGSSTTVKHSSSELRVAVVGAGIAGLTLGAALGRAGIDYRIYEQAPQLGEVGAGIQLAPNATRILHRLGLRDRLAAVAVRPLAIEMRRWDDAVLASMPHGDDCERLFGAPYYTVHRADLHATLRSIVPSSQIVLGSRCVAVEDRGGEAAARFQNGTVVTADVVVGTDGVHSVVRDALIADEPRFSGQTIYRALVPAERLPREDPRVRLWFGPRQHLVCYPVSGGRQFSLGATTPADDWREESWSARGRIEDLLEAYSGWHTNVQRILAAPKQVGRWALYDRDPVARWHGGRIVIAGDAAHPMLPFRAQGANQAVEDAAVLALCLAEAPRLGIEPVLQRYEALRKERTTSVQLLSRENARTMHHDDGDEQLRRDLDIARRLDLESQAWLYGFDAEAATWQPAPTAAHASTPV